MGKKYNNMQVENSRKNPNQSDNENENKKNRKKKGSNKESFIFFGIMVLAYIILYFIYPEKIISSMEYVFNIVKEILPILLFVYVFMLLFSFINEDKIKAAIEKAPSAAKYILMCVLGTLSHGPIYAWYPFIKDLNKKGLSKGTMGTFLYSRGIKLTLLPMLISFFDFKYVIILTITTLVFSIIEGIIIDLTYKTNITKSISQEVE